MENANIRAYCLATMLYGPIENRGSGPDAEHWSTVTFEQALAIPESHLKSQPFFRPFQISALHNHNQGSAIANQFWPRAKTLAEGIPALSFAAGSNPINAFVEGGRNKDMMDLKNNDDAWPLVRINDPGKQRNWLHSDAKDIPLRYNHKLYLDWINRGGLKEAR